MPSGSGVTPEQIQEAIEKHGTQAAAAKALNIHRRTLISILQGESKAGRGHCGANYGAFPQEETLEEATASERLQAELRTTRKQLREALRSRVDALQWDELVGRVAEANPAPPKWLVKPRAPKGKTRGIPSTALSDIHYGEVVEPGEVEYLNAYNAEIAQRRLQTYFRNVVHVAKHHLAGIQYEGLVLQLLGDMVSGELHEEFLETNERTMPEAILEVTDQISLGIVYLSDEFGEVHCKCVPGNHGRTRKKPHAKLRARRNYDWLIYNLLALRFEGDKRVTFDISDAADLRFSIFGTSYLATHGDQFRGGSGISGLLTPMMLGDARKRKRAQAADRAYDIMVMGHWHQLQLGFAGIVVNGSVKGFDEYAYCQNLTYEPPAQAFWLTDPERGMTIRAPIYCTAEGEAYA